MPLPRIKYGLQQTLQAVNGAHNVEVLIIIPAVFVGDGHCGQDPRKENLSIISPVPVSWICSGSCDPRNWPTNHKAGVPPQEHKRHGWIAIFTEIPSVFRNVILQLNGRSRTEIANLTINTSHRLIKWYGGPGSRATRRTPSNVIHRFKCFAWAAHANQCPVIEYEAIGLGDLVGHLSVKSGNRLETHSSSMECFQTQWCKVNRHIPSESAQRSPPLQKSRDQ